MTRGGGSWITTENGHHVHLNEEGVPDKGNPKVVDKMTGGLGKALTASKRHRETAKVFIPKSKLSKEDYDEIKIALSYGDKEHYSKLSEKNMEALNTALDKARKVLDPIDKASRVSDIDKELEKLHRSARKAEHYGGNESGDYETVSSIEKKINALEKEREKLSK